MSRRPFFKTMLTLLAATTAATGAGSAYAELANAGAAVPPPPADLVLYNGHVLTPSGWVSAVASSDGAIVALGDDALARASAAANARMIDLHGQTVLPGLHDMHAHPISAGTAEMQCQIAPDSTMERLLATTAACVKAKKPGEWVVGRAYEPAALGAAPNKALLDTIAPDNPVILTDVSIHASWANSAALRLAGITRDTPDPKGGVIDRDANGEPTGILREAAAFIAREKVPAASRADNVRALQWALDKMMSYGIVAFDDALVTTDAAQAYADLADSGKLKPFVRGCLISTDPHLITYRQVYARARFEPTCIKILTDGVPNDSHTAAMLDPYRPVRGVPHDERPNGLLMIPPAQLARDVTRYDAMGFTVKLHAAGDAAVHESLEAIAAARKANGFSGQMHDVAHNSFVAPSDLVRAHDIGATLEFSPYIWFDSPIVRGVQQAVGPERMKRWIPVKEALDAGVFVIPGSDWNVVPSVNPWLAMETLVTRRGPGGSGEPVGLAEAITLQQAFNLFTINSARHMNIADRSGTIEIGKRADLVVVDRDIFAVPVTAVHDTRVVMTIIDGEVVYARPGPDRLPPNEGN